jgi:hypothetical protein
MVGGCGSVNGRVGGIDAIVAGRKHEKRRRSANFVAVCAAGSTWSAAALAQMRQERGTYVLLRDYCDFSSFDGENG